MRDVRNSAGDALVNDTLREMMSASEDYMFVKDAGLVYHGGSEAFAHMAGLGAALELPGKTDLDIFVRDIAEKYRADDRKVLESGEPIDGILERLPDLDGKQRWTRTWKHAIRDSEGTVVGLYGIGRDVSNEVMLEDARQDRRGLRQPDQQHPLRRRHPSRAERDVLSGFCQRRIHGRPPSCRYACGNPDRFRRDCRTSSKRTGSIWKREYERIKAVRAPSAARIIALRGATASSTG
jgi:PAS domain S-box-containing protein